MSVHGMKPQFTDWAGYQAWRAGWRELYALASDDVRNSKNRIKEAQRVLAASGWLGVASETETRAQEVRHDRLSKMISEHRYKRSIARKLMTVLDEAKVRWGNIRAMRQGIQEQAREFPLTIEGAKNIDFHFNKKSVEFDFIPMWVLKVRGKTYYVNHMDCQAPWTTRETPDHPSTKGSLRIRRGSVSINEDGVATIS